MSMPVKNKQTTKDPSEETTSLIQCQTVSAGSRFKFKIPTKGYFAS